MIDRDADELLQLATTGMDEDEADALRELFIGAAESGRGRRYGSTRQDQ